MHAGRRCKGQYWATYKHSQLRAQGLRTTEALGPRSWAQDLTHTQPNRSIPQATQPWALWKSLKNVSGTCLAEATLCSFFDRLAWGRTVLKSRRSGPVAQLDRASAF